MPIHHHEGLPHPCSLLICAYPWPKVELSDMLAKSNAQFLDAVEREEAEVIRFEKEGKHLSFYQGASL